MERSNVIDGIKEILSTVRTVDKDALEQITEDSDFITDLGLPSTELINVIAKAEDRFGLEFDDDDVDDLGSRVGDTVDLVIKTMQNQ